MIKRYIILPFIALSLSANEPSAFEKQSGATKNDIKTLQNLLSRLQQKVDSVSQTQEGISSLYESQSAKLQQQVIQITQTTKDIESLKAQIELLGQLKSQIDTNTREIQTLKTHLKEVNESLTALNQTILKELKQLSNTSTQNQPPAAKNTPTKPATTTPSFTKDKTKKAEIFTQAQTLFKKAEHEAARIRFEWLIQINHKKAESYFYLGEISFANKAYNTAIKHYKESVLLDDKSSYMPTLLLHTAQSFNAIKDTKKYNKFLDSLINHYSTSKEAQEAEKLKNQNKEKK